MCVWKFILQCVCYFLWVSDGEFIRFQYIDCVVELFVFSGYGGVYYNDFFYVYDIIGQVDFQCNFWCCCVDGKCLFYWCEVYIGNLKLVFFCFGFFFNGKLFVNIGNCVYCQFFYKSRSINKWVVVIVLYGVINCEVDFL